MVNCIVSKNNIQTSQQQKLQTEVSKLRKTNVEQNKHNWSAFKQSEKFDLGLEQKKKLEERYRFHRKLPVNSGIAQGVTLETLNIFDRSLWVYLERPSIKACHVVLSQLIYSNMPTVILKFIHSDCHKEVLKKRLALRNNENAVNGRKNLHRPVTSLVQGTNQSRVYRTKFNYSNTQLKEQTLLREQFWFTLWLAAWVDS